MLLSFKALHLYLFIRTAAHHLPEVRNKRDAMDKGIHIGSWGQLQGQKP